MTGIEKYALRQLCVSLEREAKENAAASERWKLRALATKADEEEEPERECGHATGMACAQVGLANRLRELLKASEE